MNKLSFLMACFVNSLFFGGGKVYAGTEGIPIMPGVPLSEYHVKDSLGRDITYYLSKPKSNRAPILLMIQGSGCSRVMNVNVSEPYSTIFNFIPFSVEGDFTLLAVEKPFSGEVSGQHSSSVEHSCSTKFHKDFSAESWLVALQAGLKDARKKEWVDNSKTAIFGISEGAAMAALLSSHDPKVTDVISTGGSGSTQLFDFVSFAYQKCFNVSNCLEDISSKVNEINKFPSSSDRFVWGHPFKRWSSFFRVDPSQELLKSDAKVYLVIATADQATPPLSQELLAAQLKVAKKNVTVRRVVDADHSLMNPENPSFDDLDAEYRLALGWLKGN